MISYIDTDKVKDVARNLQSIVDELDMEFNTLFKRLSNVTSVTQEWVGDQAETYFMVVASDKQQYITFINELRGICRELKSEASLVQDRIELNNQISEGI